MTQPDSEDDQQRAVERLTMDYPVTLERLPDALLDEDQPDQRE